MEIRILFFRGNCAFQTVNTPPPPANNGVSRQMPFLNPNPAYQLGDLYQPNNIFVNTNTPLTANRQVRLNGRNFVFSGTGNVGIGLSYPVMPTEVLDVNGNIRLRNLPAQQGQTLIVDIANGSNSNDLTMKHLDFTKNTNQVLLGNGTWGTLNNGIGNTCGATPNPLTNDLQIPLGGHTLNLTENAMTPASMYVGFPTCNAFPTRFGVLNDTLDAAGYFNTRLQSTAKPAIGIHATSSNTKGQAIGVSAIAEAKGKEHAIAVNAQAKGTSYQSAIHIAVNALTANAVFLSVAVNADINKSSSPANYGHQTDITNSIPTSENFGVQSIVFTPGKNNYGGHFTAAGATNNYGIYATALPVSGSTPPTRSNYAGYFNGDVVRTGTDNFTSDANLKQNIQPITNATAIVNQLQPKNYFFNQTVHPNMGLPTGKQWGLIAQDVEQVLPELVSQTMHPAEYDTLGNVINASFQYKSLNYQVFTGILIQAVKEQNQTIDSLQTTNDSLQNQLTNLNTRLTQLENCLSGVLPFLCQLSHNAIQQNTPQAQEAIRQQLSVYLSNKEAIILDQNVPNPFAEQTVINFSIPESVKSAQIHFYDGIGSLIKTLEINQRGLGSITVFGADLSSGTYMYTLVADGINVATKKMVKQ